VFRAPFGAVAGGGIYHSQSPEAAYCHVPGLKVVAPAIPSDAKGLLKSAVRDDDPVVFFEHKRNYRTVREDVGDDLVPIGVARIDRPGRDLTLVTYGGGVHLAREAAATLAGEGLDVEIVDLRTLAPFDREAVARSVQRTGRLLVLHEANTTMGFGAEVAAFAAEQLFTDLDAPIRRLGAADSHPSYNAVEQAATLEDVRTEVLTPDRLNLLVCGVFAAVALAIAVVGVAGVLAFSVSARTREFGIRLALGSQPRQLLKGVIGEGVVMASLGVLAGASFGFLLARLAGRYFLDLKMPGALPVAVSATILLMVAVVASMLPAARAARVDVMQALRSE